MNCFNCLAIQNNHEGGLKSQTLKLRHIQYVVQDKHSDAEYSSTTMPHSTGTNSYSSASQYQVLYSLLFSGNIFQNENHHWPYKRGASHFSTQPRGSEYLQVLPWDYNLDKIHTCTHTYVEKTHIHKIHIFSHI